MINIKGYCRIPGKKDLSAWDAGLQTVNHEGELERLLHDVTREAEKTFRGFKGPVLLLITPQREDPAKDRLEAVLGLLGDKDPAAVTEASLPDQPEPESSPPPGPEAA